MRLRDVLAGAATALRRRSLATSTRALLVETAAAELKARRPRSGATTAPHDAPLSPTVPPPHPVDIVYTWVDDSDPAWRTALAAARRCADEPVSRFDDAARFRSYDELRYSLRTIASRAPWFRRVYIVTASQAPSWLVEDDRLHVVEHRDILAETALPTFNSHAIESRLHHIPGLARHFVYFNDDMLLGRRVDWTLFFDDETMRPAVFREVAEPPDQGRAEAGMYQASRTTTDIVERLTGVCDGRMVRHAPYALDRETLLELEALLAPQFSATAGHHFRHVDDLSVAASLAPRYGLARGTAVERHPTIEYVSLAHPLAATRMRRIWRTGRFDLYCLNSTERGPADGLDPRWMRKWLERLAPEPSPWERAED